MKELVVNWHITEVCNFKCKYCFAKWEKSCKNELLHDPLKVSILLDQILLLKNRFFDFGSIRLNLVGGEIFLYPDTIEHIVVEAKKRGMRLSSITNGSLLNSDLNKMIAENFDVIGFSIDSICDATNLSIGRKMAKTALSINDIIENINSIRFLNPKIEIKINTVVNKFNYTEYMGDFISLVLPNKWKIFKVLPIKTDKLNISSQEFEFFLDNHKQFDSIISAENNDEMTHSYLMIDPLGRFFQNRPNNFEYVYSNSILDVGIINALQEIPFDVIKFRKRYKGSLHTI